MDVLGRVYTVVVAGQGSVPVNVRSLINRQWPRLQACY